MIDFRERKAMKKVLDTLFFLESSSLRSDERWTLRWIDDIEDDIEDEKMGEELGRSSLLGGPTNASLRWSSGKVRASGYEGLRFDTECGRFFHCLWFFLIMFIYDIINKLINTFFYKKIKMWEYLLRETWNENSCDTCITDITHGIISNMRAIFQTPYKSNAYQKNFEKLNDKMTRILSMKTISVKVPFQWISEKCECS